MVELGKDLGFEFMNGFRERPEAGNHLRLKRVDQFVVGVVRGMNGQLLRGDEPAASFGSLAVVVNMALADLLVFPQVGHVGCKMNPVGHHSGSNLQRRKKISEFTHSPSPALLPSRTAMSIPLGDTQSPTRC